MAVRKAEIVSIRSGGPPATICSTFVSDWTYYVRGKDGQVLAEYADLDGKPTTRYIYAGSQRIAMVDSLGNTYYYLNDHLGSAGVLMSSAGLVRDHYRYTPFGENDGGQLVLGAAYRYTGKPLDTEFGLDWYYYGVRYYDPDVGRFLAVDPLASKYPSTSPYVYCANNPVKYKDLDGTEVTSIQVNLSKATARIYSDIHPVREVPVAIADLSQFSGPTAGTTLYYSNTVWDATSPLWAPYTVTPWSQNQDNPFGPVYFELIDASGKGSVNDLHGTNGPLVDDVRYLGDNGGANPDDRKVTHGCTRLPNQTAVDIANEGIRTNAPVRFVDDAMLAPQFLQRGPRASDSMDKPTVPADPVDVVER